MLHQCAVQFAGPQIEYRPPRPEPVAEQPPISPGEVAITAVERIGAAGILLTSDGRVAAISTRASAYLGTALSFIGGRLRAAACRASDERLQKLVAAALNDVQAETNPTSVLVRSSTGLPLLLRVQRLPRAEEAAVLVTVSGLTACGSALCADFARAFGLTPAEMRLAEGLHAGRDLNEIAQQAGTSIGTVRAQLKSVFAKTGARCQRELTAILVRASDPL